MTKVKRLEKLLGGHWKYVGMLRWECDDGRSVQGCSRGVDEFDNPLPGGPVWYLYTKDGAQLLDWPSKAVYCPVFK